VKQNETSQPGGPSRIRTAAPNKRWLAMVAATVLFLLLLAFHRWRRKQHKNLELIVSETPPTGQTQG
jgi:hypothetical protein